MAEFFGMLLELGSVLGIIALFWMFVDWRAEKKAREVFNELRGGTHG